MYKIIDQQIDYILSDMRARGVEMESLQQNLLDHVCCIIEQNLEEDGDFEGFYQKTIQTFYKDELWEIEEETLLLLTYKNYYTMKKVMIISGIISATTMSIGIFLKFMHWQGAGICIALGIVISSLIFVPLLFTFKAKEQQNIKDKLILGIAMLSGILISFAILFKMMHWPGANIMGIIFISSMVLLFIPFYFFTGIRNPERKVNTIVTSILMIMGCGLFLALVNSRPYVEGRANEIAGQYLQDSYNYISQQNKIAITAHVADSLSNKNLKKLTQKCNKLCDQIEYMKLDLVHFTENIHLKELNYQGLGKLDNYYLTTMYLFSIGGLKDSIPEARLANLKKDLDKFNNFTASAFKLNTKSLIDLADKKDLRTEAMVTWEVYYFYHTPLKDVLRNLTQLQINIRFIELSCMKH